MQKIFRNFITNFTWSSFTKITLNDKWLYDSNFRIVHLTDCPGLSDFQKVLCENNSVRYILMKSEYLFCLVVHVETINESTLADLKTIILNEVFIDSGKHFLIEFYSDSFVGNVRFVFNHRKVTQFTNLRNGENTGYGNSSATGVEIDDLWTNKLDKTLLEFGLEAKDYETYIKDATDCLFLRLLKSFNISIKLSVEKEILKKLVTKNHEAVKAYLELPIVEVDNENSISPNSLTKKILNFNYTLKKKSLLCIAVEGAELDVVKLLLRLGFDINQVTEDGKTATDYCHNGEILKFLLNNDAKFPIDFVENFENFRNCSGSKRDIFDIAIDREKLHAAIKSKNENEIRAFRTKYPNLRMAYIYMDTAPYNQSATMTSLKEALVSECSEQEVEADPSQFGFQFYAFLFRNGFRDDYKEIENLEMATGLQEKINKLLLNSLKYSQPAHIGYLRNKTKIGTIVGMDSDRCQEIVDEIYQHINDIGGEEVNNILKILEHSQFLTIVIDFHSKYVNPMCPLLNKETDGITFQNDGNIYIGARGKSNTEIAATLVHELSHFAIHITFDNACNPFYANDNENEKKMSDIVNHVHQIQKACDVDTIKSVFRYDNSLWARELIVRVPELIILGKRELFDDEKYKILFDFFKNRVLSVIENIIREPEDFRLKRDVEQLNCYLGNVEQIKCFKGKGIWPNNTKLPKIQNAHSLVCTTPNLLLADIFINLIEPTLISTWPVISQNKKNFFILASVDDFHLPLKVRRILRTWKSTSDVTLILNCENYDETFLQQLLFFKELNKKRKIILFGSNPNALLNILPNLTPVRVQYSWTDIDRKNVEILFQREISFQGADVALNTLIDTDCNVITLEKLINDRPIEVETFKVSIDNYDDFRYIDRRFITYRNVDNMLSLVSNEKKTLLLSGVSGCGKSIIFSRIFLKFKEKRQHFGVFRINLHEWGESFEAVDASDHVTFLTNILVQTDDESDRQFQRELFKNLYQNSKVILLFDAYDELNVTYRETFKLLIDKLSQNVQIWISTRPQFVEGLKTLLKGNYILLQLDDFSYDDMYNCATKLWQNSTSISNDREIELKLKECANVMITQFTDSVKAFLLSASFLQPSIIIILAEYYQQHVSEFIFNKSGKFNIDSYIDIFDIYKMIVIKKVLILYRQKGTGIAAETAADFLYQDVVAYLEHLSLLSRFGSSVVNNFDNFVNTKYEYFDIVEQTNEFLNGLLQRSGLISISDSDDRRIYFIDDSVCDYFIANFVIRKLKRITYLERSIDQPEFNTAMKVLCMNVIHPIQNHLTLITFIDEGLKRFWDGLSESVFDVTTIYFNRTPEITFEFGLQLNFLDYLLQKDAIFLLAFFVNCFLTMESTKFDIVKSANLFRIASDRGVFCIVDMFWREKALKALVIRDRSYVNAFRQAFSYFPENKVAAVKDNTTFYQLKNALTKSNEYDNSLQALVEGNMNNSTLHFLAAICKEAMGNSSDQEQLHSLIVFDDCDFNYDYYISVDFFEHYVEMKWNALQELGYYASTWEDVTKKTLFGTIVAKIFFKFDNILVLKFYNWAYSKQTLSDSFRDFVEDTIVRYLHRCRSTSGADEVFQFLRKEVDIKSIYRNRSNELKEHYYELELFLRTCKQNFTKEEFIALLTGKNTDDEENYFEYILKSRTCELADVLLILNHFKMGDVELMDLVRVSCNITAPFTTEMLHTINKTILAILYERCATGRGKQKSTQIINCIESLFSEPLKEAFQSPQMYERTIFQSACLYEDIGVLHEVWLIAKRIRLTNDELKNLLLLNKARIRKTM